MPWSVTCKGRALPLITVKTLDWAKRYVRLAGPTKPPLQIRRVRHRKEDKV